MSSSAKGKAKVAEVDYLSVIPAEIWIQIFEAMFDIRDITGLTTVARTCKSFRNWATPILYSSLGLQTHCLQLQKPADTSAAETAEQDEQVDLTDPKVRRDFAKKSSLQRYHAKNLPPRHHIGMYPIPRPWWCNYRYMASIQTDIDILSAFFDEDAEDTTGLKPYVKHTRTFVITNECRHSDCTTLTIEPVTKLHLMNKLNTFRYAMCCPDDAGLLENMLTKLNDPARQSSPMKELVFEDVSSVDALHAKLPPLNGNVLTEPLGPILSHIRSLQFLWLTRMETDKLRNLLWCVKDTLRELVIAAKQGLASFDAFDQWPGQGAEEHKLKLKLLDITFFINLPQKIEALQNAIDFRQLEKFNVVTYRPSGLPAFILGFLGNHADGQPLLRNLEDLWIEEPLNQYEDVKFFWEKVVALPKLRRLEAEVDNGSLAHLHDALKGQVQKPEGSTLKRLYVVFTEEQYRNLEEYLENVDFRRKALHKMKDVGLEYIGCHERNAHVNLHNQSDKTVQPFQDVYDLTSFLDLLKNYKASGEGQTTYNEGDEFGGEKVVVQLNEKETKAMREGLDSAVTLAKPKDFFVAHPWGGKYTQLDPTGTQCLCVL